MLFAHHIDPEENKNRVNETLSKILCKWKQDSAVSLFLYLDSVFKNKHKLIHNQAPVMNRLCPFLLNLHKWKINGLFDCIIRREWKLWFRVLSDFSVQVFNEICDIDYFSDFQRKLKENGQVIPVISPGKYGTRILSSPISFSNCQVLRQQSLYWVRYRYFSYPP